MHHNIKRGERKIATKMLQVYIFFSINEKRFLCLSLAPEKKKTNKKKRLYMWSLNRRFLNLPNKKVWFLFFLIIGPSFGAVVVVEKKKRGKILNCFFYTLPFILKGEVLCLFFLFCFIEKYGNSYLLKF